MVASTILPDFTVTINFASTPTLVATSNSVQPDGFHVSINGPANSLIEIMASDDLVNLDFAGELFIKWEFL